MRVLSFAAGIAAVLIGTSVSQADFWHVANHGLFAASFKDVIIDPDVKRTYPRIPSGCESYIDPHTDEYRKVFQSDVKDCAIIADALENIYYTAG